MAPNLYSCTAVAKEANPTVMAFYLVCARPRGSRLADLRRRLNDGELEALYSFGNSLSVALREARIDPATGDAVWEQEDHDRPPLAQKEVIVLNRYFTDLRVKRVQPTVGWHQIETYRRCGQRFKTEPLSRSVF
jgi:hypothetical protein